MNDYDHDLGYQLELMRECGLTIVPKEAARVIDDLAHGMASGEMRLDEIRSKRALLSSLAQEMKGLPEMLEMFKWEHFYLGAMRQRPAENGDGSTDIESTLYGHRHWDAKLSIVRAECGFLEPYLTIQLCELQAILKKYGMLP